MGIILIAVVIDINVREWNLEQERPENGLRNLLLPPLPFLLYAGD